MKKRIIVIACLIAGFCVFQFISTGAVCASEKMDVIIAATYTVTDNGKEITSEVRSETDIPDDEEIPTDEEAPTDEKAPNEG